MAAISPVTEHRDQARAENGQDDPKVWQIAAKPFLHDVLPPPKGTLQANC
jgi:hypothetical protein